MANFANSVLPTAIVEAQRLFKQLEDRESNYGAVKAFRNNTQEFSRINRLATERQKPGSFRMSSFAPASGSGALTCSPTATSGDSVDTSLTWQLVTGEMVISNKRATENLMTVEEQAVVDMKNMWSGIYQDLEEAAMSYLNTNRSQNDISQGSSTWNGSTDFYNSIALAKKDNIRSIIRSEMRKAKYDSRLNIVYSAPYDEFFENTEIQGSGNSRNFNDQDKNFDYNYTNEDITLASTYGGMFVIPIGGIAMLTWIAPIYREGKMAGDKEWGRVTDPVFGLEMGYYRKDDCADSTLVGGGPQDLVESVQFHVNVAFTHAPVTSPTNETVIHKYALATS
jgi:hypothetical protein